MAWFVRKGYRLMKNISTTGKKTKWLSWNREHRMGRLNEFSLSGQLAQSVECLVYTERVSGSSPLLPSLSSYQSKMEWGDSSNPHPCGTTYLFSEDVACNLQRPASLACFPVDYWWLMILSGKGWMSERFKESVLKTEVFGKIPGVRIPLHPWVWS